MYRSIANTDYVQIDMSVILSESLKHLVDDAIGEEKKQNKKENSKQQRQKYPNLCA